MAKKISDLALVTQANAADEFEILQAGVSKRVSLNLPWVFGGQVTVGSLVSGAGTFSGAVAANAGLTASALTVSALTSGRIPFASTGGLLADSANLQWSAANNQLLLGDGSAAAPAYSFSADTDTGRYRSSSNFVVESAGGFNMLGWDINAIRIRGDAPLSWSSTADVTLTGDLLLYRDAANTLAQRNGVNAQTQRWYETFTDAANFSRVSVQAASTHLILSEAAGTGTLRALTIGVNGAASLNFRVNSATQWFIDTDNFLKPASHNTLDFGTAALASRTGYFGTSVLAPLVGTGAASSLNLTTSGGTQVVVGHAASAVNFVQLQGAPTTGAPIVGALGNDTNISLNLASKGSSPISFFTNLFGPSVEQFRVAHTTSAVNFLQATGGATGAPGTVTLSAQGSDANVDIALTPKGTGAVRAAGSVIAPFTRVDNSAVGAAVADSVQVYSTDDAAGHTIPSFFTEGTNVLATGQADSASSVRVKMRINNTVVTLLAV